MQRAIVTLLAGCALCAGCKQSVDVQPTLPMRHASAVVHVTYHTPVRISYDAPVAENTSIRNGGRPRHRGTAMQAPLNDTPPSPGRVVWELAGTVDRGDVYVVQVFASSDSTNASVFPVIYDGTDLVVHGDETLTISITGSKKANSALHGTR